MNGDDLKRYLIILADRQRGRFLTVYMDTFENQGEEFFEQVPQKVKAEHTRPGRVQSHIKDHIRRHFKHVGKYALEYLIKKGIRQLDGVFIGGHREFLHKIKEALPSKLKNKVKGEFVTDFTIPAGDLAKQVKQKFSHAF